MALESWLPIGFTLLDGAKCRRALHEGKDWQIIETEGHGSALVANQNIHGHWLQLKLIDSSSFSPLSYGTEKFFEVSCGPSQSIVPVSEGRSPNTKNEAI